MLDGEKEDEKKKKEKVRKRNEDEITLGGDIDHVSRPRIVYSSFPLRLEELGILFAGSGFSFFSMAN